MKKIVLIMIISLMSLLVACTNKEQQAYEEKLEQAKEFILQEDFEEAYSVLTEAVAIDYKENDEALRLLEQLKQYEKLDAFLYEGEFNKIYATVDTISNIKNGSAIIVSKAQELAHSAEEQEQQFKDLQTLVAELLQLVENGKYDEANKQLKALTLSQYEEPYYGVIKETISDTIISTDKKIAKIQAAEEQRKAEAKAEAIRKAQQEEEARKKAEALKKEQEQSRDTMLNWTDNDIRQYLASYLNRNINHTIIEIHNRTNSGYSIDVYQDNEAMGVGDPGVAPSLGFFEVRSDGKLYKLDMISGEFIRIN